MGETSQRKAARLAQTLITHYNHGVLNSISACAKYSPLRWMSLNIGFRLNLRWRQHTSYKSTHFLYRNLDFF